MRYPSKDDYLKAVQRAESFTVDELAQARFVLHPVWQIPTPASGASAVVFRAVVDGVDEALRFLIRPDVARRDRYEALQRHFVTHGLAGDVALSRWMDDAIEVNGRSWPVVRMQWVTGTPLHHQVDQLVERRDTQGLADLAAGWRQLLVRLQATGFAHGDLQHGNVLSTRRAHCVLSTSTAHGSPRSPGSHHRPKPDTATTSRRTAPGGAGWTPSPGWSCICPCAPRAQSEPLARAEHRGEPAFRPGRLPPAVRHPRVGHGVRCPRPGAGRAGRPAAELLRRRMDREQWPRRVDRTQNTVLVGAHRRSTATSPGARKRRRCRGTARADTHAAVAPATPVAVVASVRPVAW
jgi:hypothetical protein